MGGLERREFFYEMGGGALGAALCKSISRAQAVRAHTRTHSIADVEHIVVLSLAHRSFDRCFGTLNGVRGFSDPRAVRLPSGKPVWYQGDGASEIIPFHGASGETQWAASRELAAHWNASHASWRDGHYDQWVASSGAAAMSYLTRKELPFYYALADAFTVCDAYHSALAMPGVAARGTLAEQHGNDVASYFECLKQAGLSCKVYRDADGGREVLKANAPAASAQRGGLLDVLRDDILRGRLAQVCWITAPEALGETPRWANDDGAWFIAQLMDTLTANPDLWSRTALLINHRAHGGYFDHMVPPSPARGATDGQSTVSTAGGFFAGDEANVAGHLALGVRVPLLVVSPWSKGGYVNSQLFDHTSFWRFIEARFGLEFPRIVDGNITPWRRAVVGDLTSAFDFIRPNDTLAHLPSTVTYLPSARLRHPDDVKLGTLVTVLPRQERGLRRARALPYRLEARGMLQPMTNGFVIEFSNFGQTAAVFQVRAAHLDSAPRSYTVEPGKRLKDSWELTADSAYNLSVYGPNGFLRTFKGRVHGGEQAVLEAHVECRHELEKALSLAVANFGKLPVIVHVRDNYSGETLSVNLNPDDVLERQRPCMRHFGWYDLLVTSDGDDEFRWQFAGHIENGRDSISDPALGRSVMGTLARGTAH